jgi:hypothetical protein
MRLGLLNSFFQIDVKTISGKTACTLVKGCKTKDHLKGNAATAWGRLKNKYEPVSAPTLVKLEKQFHRTLNEERSRSRDLDYGPRGPLCWA